MKMKASIMVLNWSLTHMMYVTYFNRCSWSKSQKFLFQGNEKVYGPQVSNMDDFPSADNFYMVSQVHWEDDIIWDSEDLKSKTEKVSWKRILACCCMLNEVYVSLSVFVTTSSHRNFNHFTIVMKTINFGWVRGMFGSIVCPKDHF